MSQPSPLNRSLQNIGAPLLECVIIFAKRDFEALKVMDPTPDVEMAARRLQDVVLEISRALQHIGPLDEEWAYDCRDLYHELREYRRTQHPERWSMSLDDGPNPMLWGD